MSESTHDSTSDASSGGAETLGKALTIHVTPYERVDAKGAAFSDKVKNAASRAAELAGRAAAEGGKTARKAAQGSADIGAASQRTITQINTGARKAAKTSADAVGQLTGEAVKATAAGARATWRFTLMTLQWVVWTSLAILLAGMAVGTSGALSVARAPLVQFWTGVALIGAVVALHFPPLFFRLPKGWKRLPYMALLPAVIGGLVCFSLAIRTLDGPSTSLIERQTQGSETFVDSPTQTEAMIAPARAPVPATRPSDLDLEEVTSKYGSGRDFDVGRFCLDEEAAGGMTFDECLGAAVVVLGGN